MTPGGTLAGKCALVTGSVQGLGLAAAERFAEAGCDVVLNGFAPAELVASIRKNLEQRFGVRTVYANSDLRHPSEIENMIASAVAAFGAVDILVNNAVVRHTAPIDEFPPASWDEALAVNLSSAFHAIRLTVPLMRRRKWGRIINVSSIYGLRGAANRAGYVTTKTALIGLTRAVALETIADNITCNAICPGTAETPVHQLALSDLMASGLSRADAERRLLAGKQPTARFVAAGSVAALMLFLCGTDAADITGAALPIDGAWSAQ